MNALQREIAGKHNSLVPLHASSRAILCSVYVHLSNTTRKDQLLFYLSLYIAQIE